MIESRYKIEYVLPDDEKRNSSSFRFFWYLLMLLMVLLLVTAITYDFSFKDISDDSKKLVEKAKVVIFNLEDQKIPTKKIPTNNALQSKKPAANSNHAIIENLTKKQQEQLETIQTQIGKNDALSESLHKLSAKLSLEQTKNKTLNVRLSEQEKDRRELEQQLNQVLAEVAENKSKLDELTLQKKQLNVSSNQKTKKQHNINLIVDNQKSENENEYLGQSNTDKIIETMSSITTPNDPKKENKARKKTENIKVNQEDKLIVENAKNGTKKTPNNKNTKRSKATSESLDLETDTQEKPSNITVTTTKNAKPKEIPLKKIPTEVANLEEKPAEKTNKVEIQATQKKIEAQQSSSIDDIIATMQGLQQSNDSTANNNTDKYLENESKSKLAEQDDVTIDN